MKVLPYHSMARSKYAALGMEDTMPHVDSPTDDDLQKAVVLLKSYGIPAISGREWYNMLLKIRDLREDRDLKQKDIAEYLICDQSLYSKYERGERPLPLEYAEKLADYYGVSVDYLLGRTNVKNPYPKK